GILFENFPLEKLYDEFNANVVDYTHSGYCDSMKDYKWMYKNIEDFCKKLVRNLENISTDKLQHKLLNNACPYLHYWFNNEVLKMISTSVGGKYTFLINRLRNPWQDINIALGNHDSLYSYNCSKLSDKPSKYNPKEFLQKLNCNEVKESEEQAAGETERNFTYISGEDSNHSMENNPSGFNSFHIFPVFSSILGVFLVSYILYKLTPLGLFLNKSVIKRNKLEEKFNDDGNSFSLVNSSDIVDLKCDNKPIHIAYNQA
ncbi:PIR Superfamily Protein, partial [Plasmodium ovale curtisi]